MAGPKLTSTPEKSLMSRINEARSNNPRLIIAIDGLGGAGKSTLARRITSAISGAAHVEYDWFHLPQVEIEGSYRFDYRRLTTEVLKPFRNGQGAFEFKRYNWGYLSGGPDGFADESISLRDVDLIVLEGCGVLFPQLSDLFDLKIWVDTPPEESLARGMRRDIEEYGLDPQKVSSAWHEWSSWEAQALARDDRRLRADVRVSVG